MPRDNKAPLQDRIFSRDFHDPEVTAALDGLSVDGVIRALFGPNDDGTPDVQTRYAAGQGGWTVGSGRPGLADDDPAVMQAIGRCASWRLRSKLPGPILPSSIHPVECAWCGYPMAEMLRACDWNVWASRYVETEILTWWQWPTSPKGDRGRAYHRSGRDGTYTNPRHAAFWSLQKPDRERVVVAAQYPETEVPA